MVDTVTADDTGDTIDIPVTFEWNDDVPAARPESLTVNLYRSLKGSSEEATLVASQEAVQDGDGNFPDLTFTGLPLYDEHGNEYEYSVNEASTLDAYTCVIRGDQDVGFTIANTFYVPKTITVTKKWVGTPTDSVTMDLYADGELYDSVILDSTNGWTHTWDDLPKRSDEDWHEIIYLVKEVPIDGYRTVVSEGSENYTFTNIEQTKVSVQKVWNDGDGENRPSSVQVQLYADGSPTGDPITLNSNMDWSYTWDGLDKYHMDRTKIEYSVKEVPIDGYRTEVTENSTNDFTITNTEQTSVSVNKVWNDGDGTGRPSSVTVQLYANGEPSGDAVTLSSDNSWTHTWKGLDKYGDNAEKIEYTVKEDTVSGYTSEVSGDASSGFTVTNTKTIDIPVTKKWVGDAASSATVRLLANGREVDNLTLTANNNWTDSFEDVAQYDNDRNEITYTLTEDSIDGYESSITGDASSGFTVTNTKTIDIPVTKKWVGDAASSATVRLLANGTEVDNLTLTANNNWTDSFEDVAQYDNDGNEIPYTLTEDSIDGYESSITGDESSGFTVTNTKTIDIPVSKEWASGTTKEPVTVELLRNGNATGVTMTLDESNGWKGTFTDQPEYDSSGTKYTYTVKEITDDYTWSVSGSAENGFVITNETREIKAGDPPVRKTITGDKPSKDSRFYFTLTAAPEKSTLPTGMTEMPMPTAASSSQSMTISVVGEGSGEFGDFVFTEPGTYVYEVKEKNTGVKGYDYDDTVYEVRYVVEEADNSTTGSHNVLTCERTILKDGIVQSDMSFAFTNKYTSPNTPNSDGSNDDPDTDIRGGNSGENANGSSNDRTGQEGPNSGTTAKNGSGNSGVSAVRTGDTSNIGLWIVVLAASAAAVTIGLLLRKRFSQRN
ncbi:MAG: Cna B-type domain-containing protein [Anaerovoracaceae bacterium]